MKLQSRGLDEIGESFMRRVDERKRELQSALDFYHHVKEVIRQKKNFTKKSLHDINTFIRLGIIFWVYFIKLCLIVKLNLENCGKNYEL